MLQIPDSANNYKNAMKNGIWDYPHQKELLNYENTKQIYAKSPENIIIGCEKIEGSFPNRIEIYTPSYDHILEDFSWKKIIAFHASFTKSEYYKTIKSLQTLENEGNKNIRRLHEIMEIHIKECFLKMWLFFERLMTDQDFVKSLIYLNHILQTLIAEKINQNHDQIIYDIHESVIKEKGDNKQKIIENILTDKDENDIFMFIFYTIGKIVEFRKQKNQTPRCHNIQNEKIEEEKDFSINLEFFHSLYKKIHHQNNEKTEKSSSIFFKEDEKTITLFYENKIENTKPTSHEKMECYTIIHDEAFIEKIRKYNQEMMRFLKEDILILNENKEKLESIKNTLIEKEV